jgi:hypothetical protein
MRQHLCLLSNRAAYQQSAYSKLEKGLEMSNVIVLTDNVAQIPPDIAQQNHIDMIHFTIIIEGKSYRDGIDIFPEDIYQRMRTEEI